MRTKTYRINAAAVCAWAAVMFGFTVLAVPRDAFAVANQTVFCEGEITSSSDSTTPANTPPTGPVFSLGNVAAKTSTPHCATTVATVTQVTQGTCGGVTPCITTLTETNSVPQDTSMGCGTGIKTLGTIVSTVTASSNPDLVGCQQTSVANTYSTLSGAYTMGIGPLGSSTCKATLTGITACVSNSQ